jgi:hypothetical protein
VRASDDSGTSWVSAGKFSTILASDDGRDLASDELVNAWSEGLIERLVRVRLQKAAKVDRKVMFRIRIDNASPLILNGLTLAGASADGTASSTLAGFSVPPRKSFAAPASTEVVQRLALTNGLRIRAVDLSGL